MDGKATFNAASSPQSPRSVRLTFMDDGEEIRHLTAENAAKHRQSIFTDCERKRMSDDMISSVPGGDPGQSLLEVEKCVLYVESTTPFAKFDGPFGVFRFPEYAPVPELEIELETSCTPMEEIPTLDESLHTPESWIEDLPMELLQEAREIIDLDMLPTSIDISPIMRFDELNPFPMIPQETDLSSTSPGPPPLLLSLPSENPEAWLLLSHYKDQIVRLISPLRHGDSTPWVSLVMPCAMSTLAELTIGGSPSNARLALLNSLLATSAFHIKASSSLKPRFRATTGDADVYVRRAQQYLKQSMQLHVTSDGKQGKYKEILMATLSLSNAFMMKGDPDARLTYLIAAERFIRANGFKQTPLSSKRRALHHCYAYMRIMAETTTFLDVTHTTSPEDNATEDTNSQSLGFRLSPWISVNDDTMAMTKDPQMAQRDLHLAIPGHWESTLFPQLYGVTETFLMLLSQVIRLANERDLSLGSIPRGGDQILSLEEYTVRAKALEKRIRMLMSPLSNWQQEQQHLPTPPATGCGDSTTTQAMYTALLIFFYRRVYDLDPCLLQGEVEKMQNYLTKIRRDDAARGDGGVVVLTWPAFIAACEALQPESQLFFSLWFDFTFKSTGLVSVSLAQKISEAIWARRRNACGSGGGCSWPDLLRAKQFKFMCI